MIRPRLIARILCGLVGIALSASAVAADQAADSRRATRDIVGWKVHISRELLASDAKATARALELLETQLDEITRVVPKPAVVELQKVPLWVSPEYPKTPPRAEFHPDAGWLRSNGRDPEMVKGVEFTNVRIFEAETRRMPNFALHELAHAYHNRVLQGGFANDEIKLAFDKAKASGKYDRVERQDSEGRKRLDRAYALTSPQEYFAETTEAFFTHNDFFPYTRVQLKQHDPEMFALLAKLWGGEARDTEPKRNTTRTSNSKPSRPNIVVLYADDMGFGDLGIQNPQSKIPTPHLDGLAREGTRFTDAHSSSGICTPSRYALLHGRYHWRKFHGIVNSFDQPVLDSERTTLPELLKTKGYHTACIGKWHLGWDWNAIKQPNAKPQGRGNGFAPSAFDWSKPIPGGPLDHGFDAYFGDDVPNFPPYAWIENDRVITAPTVMLATPEKTAEGAWEARPGPSVKDWDFWAVMPKLTERAVEWIGKQKQDEPFFLYFPFTSPHAPIVPAKDFVGKSQANGFGDFVAQTDDTVGRVLKALRDGGFADNTLVVFSADNGPEHYAYERVRKFDHRSMGPLRGLKRDIWEGGHRVPFVVRWPSVVPAGQVNDGLISQIDLLATIAAVVGMDIPANSAEDSYNQLALLKGAGPSVRTTLVHNTNPNGYALRHGDWVLIAAKTGEVSKVPPWFDEANGYAKNPHAGELYNLREDLAQKKNLYAEMPDKVQELTALLREIRAKGQVR